MKYLLLLLPLTALADNNSTNVYNFESQVTGSAIGLAAGAQQFDLNTKSTQWSVGAGNFDDSSAFMFGIGKRVGKNLFSGSIGQENGKTGISIGISGTF